MLFLSLAIMDIKFTRDEIEERNIGCLYTRLLSKS